MKYCKPSNSQLTYELAIQLNNPEPSINSSDDLKIGYNVRQMNMWTLRGAAEIDNMRMF